MMRVWIHVHINNIFSYSYALWILLLGLLGAALGLCSRMPHLQTTGSAQIPTASRCISYSINTLIIITINSSNINSNSSSRESRLSPLLGCG